MKLSDSEITEIINNNCGNPPSIALLKHSIWINEWKLDFKLKGKHRFESPKDYEETIESLRKLVAELKRILNLYTFQGEIEN